MTHSHSLPLPFNQACDALQTRGTLLGVTVLGVALVNLGVALVNLSVALGNVGVALLGVALGVGSDDPLVYDVPHLM